MCLIFIEIKEMSVISKKEQPNTTVGFSPAPPWGPHGGWGPNPHGGGELTLKNPGGGGFQLKPHGVLVGFYINFCAFQSLKVDTFAHF